MWSSLKKLHWPEVTPIHHILKSNVRRKVAKSKFPTAWLNMREQVRKCLTSTSPHVRVSDSRIWESKIRGKFCSWYPESKALEPGIEFKYSEIPIRHWNPESTFHWKRLQSSTWNSQSTELGSQSKTVLYPLTWGSTRENDLRERIPHTWPSSQEYFLHFILGSVSYCVVILRTPPY